MGRKHVLLLLCYPVGQLSHAVLSMGVHSASIYEVEFHADDGGMKRDGGAPVHRGGAAPKETHPANYSLARALLGE